LNNALTQATNSLSTSYVTESYFVAQNYITQTYLASQNFVTASYVAAQNYAPATALAGYLTANQTITVSGDASGSGSTSIALTLASTGVSAGTYSKVVVNAKGLVTAGSSLVSGDVTAALGFTPLSLTNFGASIGTNGYQILPSGLIIQWVTGNTDPADNTTPTQILNWALTFPNGLIGASVSTYIATSANDDTWYQVISSGSNSSQVIVQRQAGQGVGATFNSTTKPFIIGIGN
jgi:hypothetical protein